MDDHNDDDKIEARYFDLDLTLSEKEERGRQVTEMVGQLVLARQEEKRLKDEKKAQVEALDITRIAREAKLRADALDKRLQQTQKAAATGKESRLIDCHWSLRTSDGMMVLRREDDGTIVDRRRATEKELQGELFGGDGVVN